MPHDAGLRFAFEITNVPRTFEVVAFSGDEAMSALYSFEIDVVCDDPELGFDTVIGQHARLVLDDGDETPRTVHGVVSRIEQGDDAPAERLASYRITIVPRVARLELRRDCRIFQHLNVTDIVRRVFAAASIPSDAVRFDLEGEARRREYCVQYRESDWNFVARLLEESGISTYFDHSGANEVLVLANHRHAYTASASDDAIAFRRGTSAPGTSMVTRFRYGEEMRSNRVTVRDYAYTTPTVTLEGRARTNDDAALEVYDYPGGYDTERIASSDARVRLEAMQSARRAGSGESSSIRLEPGRTFTLAEHPRASLNRRYLAKHVHHEGAQPLHGGSERPHYLNQFECVPDDTSLRPALVTPKPSIRGAQTAQVVGPAGEEIHTDDMGRVKVQFHWDRAGRRDENSSCWIRVSQASAGAGWGALFIPRVGQEVIVTFLDGDPDRPLVTGCVYHAGHPPPASLPAEKARSTIRTSSTPGGSGSNELRFDDAAGYEEIYLHGQRDWAIRIEHDKTESVAHDETIEVGNDRDKSVEGSEFERIARNKTIRVGLVHDETIGADERVTVQGMSQRSVALTSTEVVGGDKSVDVGATLTHVVGGDLVIAVAENKVERVARASEENVTGEKTVAVEGAYSVDVGGEMRTSVSGNQTENTSGTRRVLVDQKLELVCGGTKVTIRKNGRVTIEGETISVRATGPVRVEGSALEVQSSGQVSVRGVGIGIN